MLFYTAVPAGVVAGILTNPIELVFTRLQAEEFYKRGYNSFWDGLLKANEERVLFRGAVSNSLRIALLLGSMTGLHDWMKEHAYYFLGPSHLNRLFATILATSVGVLASYPFETIRTRLYLMKALPNGAMPYNNALDCFSKIIRYES